MRNTACMYLRLSREDGDSNESNSISNQRQIIKSYAKEKNIDLSYEYIDDGYSGSNFERPNFKNMIDDLNKGKFSIIMVKDLSCFGRDYIESGKYLQKIFHEKGIHFISVNDNYDSNNADVSDIHLILPIRNFINDSYCRDISMKMKSSKEAKRKNGEFIGSFAPFGYKKDNKNKHQLVVDTEVAHIIERIFNMKIEGYSSKAIADFLNSIKTVTPSKYKENNGNNFNTGFILEKSYKEYIDGYKEEETGVAVKGYDAIYKEIVEKFPNPTAIITESDKKEFAVLFDKVLKFENILRNFDEFSKHPEIINERLKQDMRSTYAEIIRESAENKPTNNEVGSQIDYSDIEFQVELLKVDEVNLDYILGLIFEKSKKNEDNEKIKEDATRLIRSSLGTRAKEGLIITFINTHNLAYYENGAEVLKAFYNFAKKEQRKAIKNVIEEENLKENSERFINYSIKNGFVDTNGTELDSILPATSRRGGGREIKKLTVLQKIQKIVEIFME